MSKTCKNKINPCLSQNKKKQRIKVRSTISNHLDYQKNLSFMYKDKNEWKSSIKTKIINKMHPELFTDKFPELTNLREEAQVDVHKLVDFYENK